ncbi:MULTISPECIES: sigma-70 family RNA polymerase sigma factor [Streptomyces]|uniref:RNA polymerase subunit sigma-70 n=2 Tax=Streptomyces TaxID=1883 RepID=A0A2U9P371_STRAS|nr:sigma-70 family RNA polymerase sigma factor [Streptomyces actuosus]AWT43977.1 RNA polymerase subunit sigma-70 [Streptomyces actuosus]MBM4820883.1 sigma-70 family RNA polymerase sigma factor [Streptomyces actuosus]
MTNDPSEAGDDFLARQFEAHRGRLRAVAYRMLGSTAEADDAVQEAWLRLGRSGAGQIDNLAGWLTTVVGRICLDMLRSRRSRAEEPLDDTPLPAGGAGPEQDALLADSVGVALLVVLDTLTPAERLAFVLHDLFGVPFEEVAAIVGRSPAAARQLASRARRRVQGAPEPEADLALQRQIVDAFLSAAREGDFDGLLRVLDPDVVARTESGVSAGARTVASGAMTYARFGPEGTAALIDGVPGVAVLSEGRPVRALSFTFVRDRIAVIDIALTPERVAALHIEVQ